MFTNIINGWMTKKCFPKTSWFIQQIFTKFLLHVNYAKPLGIQLDTVLDTSGSSVLGGRHTQRKK